MFLVVRRPPGTSTSSPFDIVGVFDDAVSAWAAKTNYPVDPLENIYGPAVIRIVDLSALPEVTTDPSA